MVKTIALSMALAFAAPLLFAEESGQKQPDDEQFEWKKSIVVKSLPYGNALFEHYRGDHFSSMTALLVAQSRQQLGGHEVGALALLGSQQLDFGMLVEAESLLTNVLGQKLPNEVKERVLVDLARVRFRGGDLDGSLRRLDALPTMLTPALKDELVLMRANIALQKNDGVAAQNALNHVNPDSDNFHYALFNLGISQIQQQQSDAAQATFKRLLGLRAQTEEQKVLRDRTYLALGYERLRQKQPAQAREQLLNVRLNSAYTNSAMLGLGWAYAQSGLYENALTPWLTLQDQQPADLAVIESLLAVPYAYQSIEAFPDAINAYRRSIARFESELARLDDASTAVEKGELLLLLPSLDEQEIPGVLMDNAKADAPLLKRVLSLHQFNESMRRYRELLEMRDVLEKWQFQLPIYSEMLANHKTRYAEREPKVDAALSKVNMAAYVARLDSAKQSFDAALLPENWSLLANDKEQALIKRAARAKEKVEKISAVRGPMSRESEKLRLLEGVLQFNVWHESAERQWQQRKVFKQAEQNVRALDAQRARLLAAREVAANRFANFDQRINAQLGGAEKLIARTEKLLDQEGQRLNEIALGEIGRWRAQIVNYRQQAELALARLQDRAVIGAKP